MSDELENLKLNLLMEGIADGTYKMTPATAKAKGLCLVCGLPALERCYSDAGRREYQISTMCEKCFDECTMEPEDAYDDFDQESEPGDGEPEPGELCEHCGKPLEEYLYTPVSVKVPVYWGCDCRA